MNNFRPSAVSPQFFIESRDIDDFVSEFGPYSGRYVVRHPQGWMKAFLNHLKDLSPIEQDRARAYAERIKHALIDTRFPYGEDKSWAENVQALQSKVNFEYIVGDALDPAPFKCWVEALPDIRKSRQGSFEIRGALSEYLEAFNPLLLISPAVYIVDAYFSPLNDDEEYILRAIFERIKGSRCFDVHIITRDVTSLSRDSERFMPRDELDDRFAKHYAQIIPKERNLFLHLVDDRKKDCIHLRLHNRFFLTRFGALDFGPGLKLFNDAVPQIQGYVVQEKTHNNHKATYIDGVARHAERLPRLSHIAYPRCVSTIKVSRS